MKTGTDLDCGRVYPNLVEAVKQGLITEAQIDTSVTRLVLSPNTVRNYVSNIFSKLQVASRAQAILRAREAGLG